MRLHRTWGCAGAVFDSEERCLPCWDIVERCLCVEGWCLRGKERCLRVEYRCLRIASAALIRWKLGLLTGIEDDDVRAVCWDCERRGQRRSRRQRVWT